VRSVPQLPNQKDTHRALNDDDFIEQIRRPGPQRKLLLIGEIDPQAAWLCTNAHGTALRVLSSSVASVKHGSRRAHAAYLMKT
jgi:hypothetical protein